MDVLIFGYLHTSSDVLAVGSAQLDDFFFRVCQVCGGMSARPLAAKDALIRVSTRTFERLEARP